MRKRLMGVDLDDVLLDFYATLDEFHNARFGTVFTRDDHVSYELERVWDCTRAEAIARVLDFYASDEHRQAQPVARALEAIRQLRDSHTLVIITSKPEYLRGITEAWLDQHFPDVFDSVHFTNHYSLDASAVVRSKSHVCDELGVELFVEDSLMHANDIARNVQCVFLLDAPWNQGDVPESVVRVASWDEIVQLVRQGDPLLVR